MFQIREFKGDIIENINSFDAVCITTNGVVKQDGRLVMGAGVAKAFRNKFHNIDLSIGRKVLKNGNKCYRITSHNGTDIVTFPTKNHWKDNSCIIRIKLSCIELVELTNKYGWADVALPKPGCSNGGLSWDYVKEEIKDLLDDRFIIVDL